MGLESGDIHILSGNMDPSNQIWTWTRKFKVDSRYLLFIFYLSLSFTYVGLFSLCHAGPVKSLAWEPKPRDLNENAIKLVSGSQDHTIRIFNVSLLD